MIEKVLTSEETKTSIIRDGYTAHSILKSPKGRGAKVVKAIENNRDNVAIKIFKEIL